MITKTKKGSRPRTVPKDEKELQERIRKMDELTDKVLSNIKHPFQRRGKRKKLRDFTCQHIIEKKDKSIYTYKLIGRELDICERCEATLRKQIFEQDKIEKEMKPFADKCRIYEELRKKEK